MTKMKFLLIILLAFSSPIYGQSDCSELLQYGIYNHFHMSESVSNYSKLKSALQNVYSKYQQESQGGSVEAEYKLFSGGASYSAQQIESLYKLMNSSDMSESDFNSNLNIVQSTISPHILNAYNECKKLSDNSGLKIKASMSPDNSSAISFDIYFRNVWSGSTPVVKGLETKSVNGEDDCFICEGDLKDIAEQQASLNMNERYSLTCYRQKLSSPRKTHEGKYIIAEEGLIKIKTSMGNYTLWVPAVELRTEIPKTIGEVIPSMLTEEQFYNLNGSENFVLADGREIGENNAYFAVTGKRSVPDLRGIYLRGKNYNRSTQTGNPQGDLALGEYQADMIGSHTHPYRDYHANLPAGIHSGHVRENPGHNEDKSRTTAPTGGAETRPRTVTVNYFIRIN